MRLKKKKKDAVKNYYNSKLKLNLRFLFKVGKWCQERLVCRSTKLVTLSNDVSVTENKCSSFYDHNL